MLATINSTFEIPNSFKTAGQQLVQRNIRNINITTQLTFTCAKSTIESLEKGVKYVQS